MAPARVVRRLLVFAGGVAAGALLTAVRTALRTAPPVPAVPAPADEPALVPPVPLPRAPAAPARFADDSDRETARRLLEALVARGHVPVVFQPIIDLDARRVVGFEALARFPTARAVGSPEPWFALAHEMGLGVAMELAAVRSALAAMGELPGGIYLSLNVSPEALRAPEMFELLVGAEHPDRLVIELTEHVLVEDYDELLTTVRDIRAHGVRLAVDDAGAGYASLRHITRLSPDIIKLDRSLVHEVNLDPVRRALLVALVAFANDIRVGLAAEGIEATDEAEALWEWGVRYGQGYLFGGPVSAPTPEVVALTELALPPVAAGR